MDSPAISKIIETEAQADQIINEAKQEAAKIAEQAKIDCEQILSASKNDAAKSGEQMRKDAENAGQAKAKAIISDYDKEVSKLAEKANKNKANAIKVAVDTVISF